MLNKKKLKVGDIVVVDKPNSGVDHLLPKSAKLASPSHPHVNVYFDELTGPGFKHRPAKTGTELRLVTMPRKRGGINLIRVAFPDGAEGDVYWCELRASCKPKTT